MAPPPAPNKDNTWLKVLLGVLIGAVLVMAIFFIINNKDKDDAPAQPLTETAAPSPAQNAPEQPAYEPVEVVDLDEDGSYHLSGKVAGQGCKMDITINGGSVYGSYSYNRFGKPLTLQGSKSGNYITMDEYDKYGDISGTLSGTVHGNKFKGTHLRYETMRETSFSFTAD